MLGLLLLLSIACPWFVNGQTAQTTPNATCTPDYSWMNNSKNVSPCLVIPQLDEQCLVGIELIFPLNGSVGYLKPADWTATPCACSWADYNLISACTACQGYPDLIANWGDYISGCSGKTSNNTYWPTAIPIPTDVRIPYWATTDPTTWPNQTFDPSQAKEIHQAHPDLPASSSTRSYLPTGVIVGGVIGGLVLELMLS